MSDKSIRRTGPPEGYADWLAELKARIHGAQQRASLAVNRELVLLYWQIGRDILRGRLCRGGVRRSSSGCRRICARRSRR